LLNASLNALLVSSNSRINTLSLTVHVHLVRALFLSPFM
jgi:hypothetical protein